MKKVLCLAAFVLSSVLATSPAFAEDYVFGFSAVPLTPDPTLTIVTTSGTHVVQAASAGWYDATGHHSASNASYEVGNSTNNPRLEVNDYFNFDLSGVTGDITSATLTAFSTTQSGTPLYSLFDVSTPAPVLNEENVQRTDIYDDLGSGVLYGQYQVKISDSDNFINVGLDAAALAELNSVANSGLDTSHYFSIGGTLNVAAVPTNPSAVPEPSSLALLGTGLLSAIGASRRRRHA